MKKAKILVAILLAVVMVLSVVAFVACGKKESTELLMWAPAAAQQFYQNWADKWAKDYKDSNGNTYTVKVGIMSEADAGTNVVQSPANAADVFLFADDQLDKMITSGAIASVGKLDAGVAKQIVERNSEGTITAASRNGQLYAYPAQADNGYFLYYNDTVLTADDVKSWEGIAAKNVDVHLDFGNGWYAASWFFTFGGEIDVNDTNFNTDKVGLKAAKAAIHFRSLFPGDKLHIGDPVSANGVANCNDGTVGALVAGGWVYVDEFAANPHIKLTKLPTIHLDDKDYQTYTFLGSKLLGVAKQGKYLEASHALANYLTSEEVQLDKALKLSAGPSNINAANNDQVKALPTLVALSQQAQWSVPQINLPGQFWTATETFMGKIKFGETTWVGNADGTYTDAQIRNALSEYRADLQLASDAEE